MDAANAFSLQYADQGLLGCYGSAESANWEHLLEVLAGNFVSFAQTEVSEVELSRAKNQLQSSIMMNLETRGVLCEDIGRQTSTLGRRIEGAELCERIQAVTAHDLMQVAQSAMSKDVSLVMLNGLMQDGSEEQLQQLERVRQSMKHYFQ